MDRELWSKAGQTGLPLCAVTEKYGGGVGDCRHEMITMEHLERTGVDGFRRGRILDKAGADVRDTAGLLLMT